MTDTTATRPMYSEVTVTLDITHVDGVHKETSKLLSWIAACLNCNTNSTEVKLINPVGRLGWPDFIDPPTPGMQSPEDVASQVELIRKIEHWLTLDREKLIVELHRAENAAETERYRLAREAETHAINENKAKALDRVMAQLSEAGFDVDEPINGGDCVELVDGLYKGLKKQFPKTV